MPLPPQKQQAPAVFTDRDESYDIEETVKQIQEQRKMYRLEEMQQMHSEFATENPELFKKCANETLTEKDHGYVVFLLKLRRQVKNKEITFAEANKTVAIYFAQEIQPELLSKNGFAGK